MMGHLRRRYQKIWKLSEGVSRRVEDSHSARSCFSNLDGAKWA